LILRFNCRRVIFMSFLLDSSCSNLLWCVLLFLTRSSSILFYLVSFFFHFVHFCSFGVYGIIAKLLFIYLFICFL
jgi:hypothetical protein